MLPEARTEADAARLVEVTGDCDIGLRLFPDSLYVLTAAVCSGNAPIALLVRCCGMEDLSLQAFAVRELLRKRDFSFGNLALQLSRLLMHMVQSHVPHALDACKLLHKVCMDSKWICWSQIAPSIPITESFTDFKSSLIK